MVMGLELRVLDLGFGVPALGFRVALGGYCFCLTRYYPVIVRFRG